MTDVDAEWADPWEHARLLSDSSRNSVLVELLKEHAPGATLIEVGCGTGVWSVLAARLGARRVIALEPSSLWTSARQLIAENGLSEVVEVLPIAIEELSADRLGPDWRGADLIFSELLNADPLAEGILSASAAARGLLAPGGRLAPHRLELHAALAHTEAHTDLSGAVAELHRVSAEHGLSLDSVVELLGEAEVEPFVSPHVRLASEAQTVLSLDLQADSEPPELTRLRFEAHVPATGAALWWTAHYGDRWTMSNAPGRPNHWGQLVCAWPRSRPPGCVEVDLWLEDDTARLLPVESRVP